MHPADRYAKLLPAGVREVPLLRVARELPEMELQAHWFAGDFGREFRTVAGGAVRVVQFGVWNREAGPDFAEAAVSFEGGAPVRGCIELDPEARDWERHGHAENPAYEGVVLHVFTRAGSGEFFTRTVLHRNVPQVLLDVASLTGEPPNPLPAAIPGRCCAPLRALTEDQAREVLLGAAQYRLRKKAGALVTLVELHGADEALFQALAATLGYKGNKLPFTLLAQRLPLRLLRKGDADALLFGVSGFLPATDLAAFDAPTRSYLRGLWERWWPRRAEFERLALAPRLWRLSGQRPVNHPQRRLAALAEIVRHWPKIRALRDRCEPAEIHAFFAKLSDEYWDFHYTVRSKPAPKRMALVGESRVTEMLANVFFPLAIASDETRWTGFIPNSVEDWTIRIGALRDFLRFSDFGRCRFSTVFGIKHLRAPLVNQRAEVAALRLFADSPRGAEFLKYAALQQGLLQIYEDFCLRDLSDCAHCPFPRQLAHW